MYAEKAQVDRKFQGDFLRKCQHSVDRKQIIEENEKK